MPRASKTKTRLHTAAVSVPSKYKLKGIAEPEPLELPIPEPLSFALDEPSTSRSQKRADFVAAVQSAPHPYLVQSKSHLRREKRKARSEASSTNLISLETALDEVIPQVESQFDEPPNTGKKVKGAGARQGQSQEEKAEAKRLLQQKLKEKGMIGEGKGRTLGEKKRRGIIQEGAKRMPAVMAHPAYKSNPWAAIREHAGNTIATKHEHGHSSKK
ncbi:hypothetical protein IAT40_002299 [Kwoniella sp. CBS 6097]